MQKFMTDLLGNAQEQLNQAQGQGQSSSSSSKPKKKKGSKAPELKGPLAVVGKLLNQESGSTVLTPKEAIQKQQKQQMESSKQGKGKKSNKEHGNASVGGANSKASEMETFIRYQTESIKIRAEQISELRKTIDDYTQLDHVLEDLEVNVKKPTFVPITKKAFIPGMLVHTSEIRVYIGANLFVVKTAKQAREVVQRRIKYSENELNMAIKGLEDLKARMNLSIEMLKQENKDNMKSDADEIQQTPFEIREPEDQEDNKLPDSTISEEKIQPQTVENELIVPEDRIAYYMKRLTELEKQEEEEEAQEKIQGKINTPSDIFTQYMAKKKQQVISNNDQPKKAGVSMPYSYFADLENKSNLTSSNSSSSSSTSLPPPIIHPPQIATKQIVTASKQPQPISKPQTQPNPKQLPNRAFTGQV
ncbi:MAG: hypothetical protein EZS28_043075 [Streblomastix strix]|uniref:Uncharacterized protein n=1 Tax=Streblomastix strix TaxID=222440 RepID=A0A5J4TT06_9EUKA|nr:MAG: hypothetical protein EZS28_043075 [Streblomastix strix]